MPNASASRPSPARRRVPNANADVITDWNIKAGRNRHRVKDRHAARDPRDGDRADRRLRGRQRDTRIGASVDAAVAAANRATLTKLMPAQQASIDAAYQAALAQIADGPAKTAGIAVGEQAAAAVLARRADDGAAPAEHLSAAHDRRHVCADGHTGRDAVVAAQALADGERGAVSAGPAARADQRCLGTRLQRGQVVRRQEQHAAQRRADRDRPLLGILATGDLSRRRALGCAGARVAT